MPSCFCYPIKCFDDKVYTKAPALYIMQKPNEDVAQIFVECLEKKNQGHLHLKLSYEAYGLDERGQENHQEATQSWLCDCSLEQDIEVESLVIDGIVLYIDMDEGYDIPVEVPAMDESLLLRQSVYPVDYMDGFKQLE
ncbi:Hypothetical predicted protein [Mytilus galloprovincialis]|uniref:Uncharacterized protein n=1 Tax=Mytilus galloprovincialis TaxID=29158 RepID=A0A8B6D6B7_MYTGA|nr:Hypothetical predicted protein [Mytilus galloprovincialis]